MGQTLFTCHFLFFEDSLYSPIWTRLPLKSYQFRKSLRQIINRVERRFRVEVRSGVLDAEKEGLFQVYKSHFNGMLSASLRHSLLDNTDSNIFGTHEVAVYDGSQLIAFSFFDLGKDSIASIKGVYDPAYARYSLGVYTMLREIAFGIEQGFQYYYPGYIVPGYTRFDYKLRIGKPQEVQFYDLKQGKWLPYDSFSERNIPVTVLTERLMEVGKLLSESGIQCQMLYYPAYEANIFGYDNQRFLESPLFLHCYNNIFPRPRFIVFYDLWKEKFVFCHCMPHEDLTFYLEYSMQYDTNEAKHFLDFLMKKSVIGVSDNADEILDWVKFVSKLIKPHTRRNWLK
ncbi:MAG: GNAT family N-acetyltransferase [Desulfobacterales bacterium]